MFIGRQEELSRLKTVLQKSGTATLIYGKRRVGKTSLIKQALPGQVKTVLYFECLKATIRENVDAFTRVLTEAKVLPFPTRFEEFEAVFSYLNTLNRQFIIAIDEYPYLKSLTAGGTVDSVFQSIIDNRLANISLIISGSQIGVMKDMLAEGNALYGRFQCVIRLQEFDYREAADFYPAAASYEKIAFYSVFGGSPFVLSEIRETESLRQNIVRTILNENNTVYLYAAHLLLSDYSNSMNAERVFAALGNGKKRYSQLEEKLNARKTGSLAKQLKSLMSMEIIRRSAPINRPNDAKKSSYEINDNLLRFFFTYIYPNQSALQMLGPDAFYEQYIAHSITDFIAHRFEEICRSYFSFLARAGKLPGIRNIGSYYYDDPVTKTNGEFDVALEYDGSYTLFEAKYYKGPMELDEIHREIGQIRRIKGINVTKIGFIAANGFAEREEGYDYYTADDLYM